MKYFLLFFLAAGSLVAQDTPAYVSRLTAQPGASSVLLSWKDPEGYPDAQFEVWRSEREIVKDTLNQAKLLATVKARTEAYEDTNVTAPSFYLVLMKDGSGNRQGYFIPYRNKTTSKVGPTGASQAVATQIVGISPPLIPEVGGIPLALVVPQDPSYGRMSKEDLFQRAIDSPSLEEKGTIRAYLLRTYPGTPEGTWAQAWLADNLGTPAGHQEAIRLYDKAAALRPNDPSFFYNGFVTALNLNGGNLNDALSKTQARILQLDPGFQGFWFLRNSDVRNRYFPGADVARFLADWKARLGSDHWVFAWIEAKRAWEENRWDEASAAFDRAAQGKNLSYEFLEELLSFRLQKADARMESRDQQLAAVFSFQRALGGNLSKQNQARGWLVLADVFSRRFNSPGDKAQATQSALADYPHVEALVQLNTNLLSKQSFQDTLDRYAPVLDSFSGYHRLRAECARALMAGQKTWEAEYLKGLALAPTPQLRLTVAKAYNDQIQYAFRYDDAYRFIQLEKAFGWFPADKAYYTAYNRAFVGDFGPSLQALEERRALGNFSAYTYEQAKETYLRWKAALERGPDLSPLTVTGPLGPSLAVSPDGNFAAVGQAPMELWDLRKQRKVLEYGRGTERAFSPDGRWIAANSIVTNEQGEKESSLYLYEAATGRLVGLVHFDNRYVSTPSWSPDSTRVAVGDFDSRAIIVEARTGRVVDTILTNDTPRFTHVAWLGNDRIAAGWATLTGLGVFRVAGHNLEQNLNGPNWPHAVGVTPDGKWMVCTDNQRTAWIWDTATWKVRSLTIEEAANQLAFHPTRPWVGLNSFSNVRFGVLDAANGSMLGTGVTFSQDGMGWQGDTLVKIEPDINTLEFFDPVTLGTTSTIKGKGWSPRRIVASDALGIVAVDGTFFDADSGQKIGEANQGVWWIRTFQDRCYGVGGQGDISQFWQLDPRKPEKDKLLFQTDLVKNLDAWQGTKTLVVAAGEPLSAGVGKQTRDVQGAFEVHSADGRLLGQATFPIVTEGTKFDAIYRPAVADLKISSDDKVIALTTSWEDGFGMGLTRSSKVRFFDPQGRALGAVAVGGPVVDSWFAETNPGEICVATDSGAWWYAVPSGKYLRPTDRQRGLPIPGAPAGSDLRWSRSWIKAKEVSSFFPDNLLGAQMLASRNLVVGLTSSGTMVWLEAATLKPISTVYLRGDSEWLLMTPGGGYAASPQGTEKAFVRGKDGVLTDITLDQLYDSLYRPDLASIAAIRAKPAADQKQSATDLLTLGGLPPTVTILSPAAGEAGARAVSLRFQVEDRGGGIGTITVYNGDVPVVLSDGSRGLKAVGTGAKAGKTLTYEALLTLSSGPNTLSVTASNKQGSVTSDRHSVKVSFGNEAVTPKLYVLAVAIEKYRDRALQLKYPVEDAKALTAGMQAKAGSLYSGVEVVNVFNADANRAGLSAAFTGLADKVGANDVFVLYFAGHGVTNTEDGEYYFLPVDFRYTGPEAVAAQGISKKDITQWLTSIQARKSLLLFDTCNSGSFLSEDKPATRGLSEKTAVDRLSRGVGRATIVASSESQVALEGYQGHGVFTWSLLDGLNGKANTASGKYLRLKQWASWVEGQVPDLTYQTWGYEQVPQSSLPKEDFPLFEVGK